MADSHVRTREWLPAYFVTLSVVTAVLLGVRIATRFHRNAAGYGLDDFFITLSWVVSLSVTILAIFGTYRYGFDRHMSDVLENRAVGAIEYAWVLDILYLAQTGFAKVSILLFYRRLVNGTYSPRFKWAIWISIALVAVYSLVIFVLLMTECIPVQATWLQFDSAFNTQYYCASQHQNISVAWVSGLLAVVTDFGTAALPAWIYLQVRLSKRARVALFFIFSIGFLTMIPCIFRLIFLVRAEQPNADKTWNSFNAIVAGKTEGDFGIICACAPCLKVCFQRFFQNSERSSLQSHSRSNSRNNSRTRSRSPVSRSGSRRSNFSRRSGRSNITAPETTEPWYPPPSAPRVMDWAEKSLDNIPEAYADDIGPKPLEIVEAGIAPVTEDYGGKKLRLTPEGGLIMEDKQDWKDPQSSNTTPTDRAYLHDDYGGNRSPHPPREVQASPSSWLNVESESSDDERELTGTWYPPRPPKNRPSKSQTMNHPRR